MYIVEAKTQIAQIYKDFYDGGGVSEAMVDDRIEAVLLEYSKGMTDEEANKLFNNKEESNESNK